MASSLPPLRTNPSGADRPGWGRTGSGRSAARSAGRFWSAGRLAGLGLAFALPVLVLLGASCGQNEAAPGDSGEPIGGGGGGFGATASAVGGADATVPDAQPDVTLPTYEELCGKGPCVPGVPDTCPTILGPESVGGGERGGARGCQVVAEDEEGERETACVLSGSGVIDAPCQSSADCLPGSACVPTDQSKNEASVGICRPYCCGDLEACPEGTFCAPRPLVQDRSLDVPVCVAVSPCELLDESSCPPNAICAVVRKTGETSCAPPGNGNLCDPCPCAAGYVCAVNTGRCQKLCRTDGSGDECEGGFCQGGSSGYPDGIGVCIGGAASTCSQP